MKKLTLLTLAAMALFTFKLGGHEYTLNNDFSISYEFKGSKEFMGYIIEEDFSISTIKNF